MEQKEVTPRWQDVIFALCAVLENQDAPEESKATVRQQLKQCCFLHHAQEEVDQMCDTLEDPSSSLKVRRDVRMQFYSWTLLVDQMIGENA